jgi:antitoxin YefM
MITGIKQKAIVGHNGKIEIATSELPEGAIVEILIFMDSPNDEPIATPALLEAIARIEARQDLVTFTPEEWNAQYHV